MEKNISSLGEFGWIRELARTIPKNSSVLKGIGDDTAVLKLSPEKETLFTTDMLIEDRHFSLSEATGYQIGWKALAVNISDIAAMGGKPAFAVVSIGVPQDLSLRFLREIYRGLRVVARNYGVQIVGGDTNGSAKLVISVALLGECLPGRAVLRSGAKVGDLIFVSGRLGGSYDSGKHLTFSPRVEEALFLTENFKLHSMMDLSDGLSSDIRRIASESRVGAWISPEMIPLTKRSGVTLENALGDGEDFELLFTLSCKEAARLTLSGDSRRAKFFTPIGKIVPQKMGVRLVRSSGRSEPLPVSGFDHFKRGAA